MSTLAPTQTQEIGTVSPPNEVDALDREIAAIETRMFRYGEISPELLKKIRNATKRALRLKREGLL